MGGFARLAQQARAAVAERERRVPLDALRELVRTAPPTVDVVAVLRAPGRAMSVIAEVKHATATFADLSGVGDVSVLARFYEAGGAACVSVVTGPTRAHGTLADLDAVRRAVDVPVLVNDRLKLAVRPTGMTAQFGSGCGCWWVDLVLVCPRGGVVW